MRISVKEAAHNFCLRLPTGLVLNRLTAGAICKEAKKHGVNITYRQAVRFLKALHAYRRDRKDWVLVEVNSAKGEYVQIKL